MLTTVPFFLPLWMIMVCWSPKASVVSLYRLIMRLTSFHLFLAFCSSGQDVNISLLHVAVQILFKCCPVAVQVWL